MIKDDKKRTHIIVTGKGGGSDEGAVRFDEAQTLTSAEQLQARENIGAADVNDIPTATSDLDNDSGFITLNDVPAQVNADWNAVSGVAEILNKPTILTEWFGTQAEYDLIDPKDPNTVYHIEGGQPVQSNWNESDNTSLAYIQNKPTIPAAQVNSDWNAVSGVAQILNKPTIPVVPPMDTETLTFTLQGGTTQTVIFYTIPTGYFYIEDASGAANTLSIVKGDANAPTIEVFKSTDQVNWSSMGTTSTTSITATVPANGKLYLKAVTDKWGYQYNNRGNTISCSGNYKAGGNVMSLLYGDNFKNAVFTNSNTYALKGLFYNNNTLIDASDLIMPATTLTTECYNNMFYNCTSLTTAPVLPATTLAQSCYFAMFEKCTSLTTAPALPATTLANGCYLYMFSDCSSLDNVVSYATSVSSDNINGWLSGVAATGDFYNLGGATYESGASGIPTGWTEHTTL